MNRALIDYIDTLSIIYINKYRNLIYSKYKFTFPIDIIKSLIYQGVFKWSKLKNENFGIKSVSSIPTHKIKTQLG